MVIVKELYDVEFERQHPEVNEEALQLIKEMGLTFQEGLYKKTEHNTDEAAFPFNIASNEQIFTYKVNFPEACELEAYLEPIPHRVLQILKKAKDTGKFTSFQIWSKPEASYRLDPVLVGFIKEGDYKTKVYLLATWGDAIEEYSILLKKAKEKWSNKFNDSLQEIKLKLDKIGKMVATGGIPKASITGWSNNKPSVSITDYLYISVPEIE